MWTLPNLLTVGRVAAAPLVAVALAFDWRWGAFALFVGAAATDWLDGALARARGQESAFGRMLDPIADKAMASIALAALLGLYGLSPLLVVPVAAILLRETLVAGLREFLAGAPVLSVTRLAKWKTAAQLSAIAVLLAAAALRDAGGAAFAAGVVLLWLAAALTAVTGWDYFSRGMALVAARDGGRDRG